MYDREKSNREQVKILNILSTVSSLGIMTICDFLLAYWGGTWLDNYFQTGDHSWRIGCISLAVLTIFLTFYRLIRTVMDDNYK